MERHSLLDLNKYIQRVIAANFTDAIWIVAEIATIRESRGHYYVELVQKDEHSNTIIAQSGAAIWAKSASFLIKKLNKVFHEIFQPGNCVQLKVEVEFHERYGFRLSIVDIDASFTLGQIELQRKILLEKIISEGLHKPNKNLQLSRVVQNLAIISSETAAGYIDFIKHLQHNPHGFHFNWQLFSSAMQGTLVESEMSFAFQQIQDRIQEFDAIIIIRGGGSKLDLRAFDNYSLAKIISQISIPVLSGIGHEIDLSIIDIVAHSQFKTPTAVAEYLINRHSDYLNTIQSLQASIQQSVQNLLNQKILTINNLTQNIANHSKERYNEMQLFSHRLFSNILAEVRLKIQLKEHQFKALTQEISNLDPRHILRLGYSITQQNNKRINSVKEIDEQQEFQLIFTDGTKTGNFTKTK